MGQQVEELRNKLRRVEFKLRKVAAYLDCNLKKMVYNALVKHILGYGIEFYLQAATQAEGDRECTRDIVRKIAP